MAEPDMIRNIVMIASSTGGPKSLQTVVPRLPGNLNAAVVVIQHMPAGFTNSLAQRLDSMGDITVKEAEDGERMKNSRVYIARGGRHLKVMGSPGHRFNIKLSDEPPREGVRPCANYSFESLAECDLDKIVCVVMTGMGADGTAGIKKLRQNRDVYTIAQDKETSIIYGMPRMIVESGMADRILPLQDIAEEITRKVGVLSDGR